MEQLFDKLPINNHLVVCRSFTDKVLAQASLLVKISKQYVMFHDEHFIEFRTVQNTLCRVQFVIVANKEEARRLLYGVYVDRYKLYPKDLGDVDLKLYVEDLLRPQLRKRSDE